MKVVEDNFLKLLVDLLGLAEDNVALALNGALVELGVLENIGKDVDGCWDIGVECLGVVDGGLALYGISELCGDFAMRSTYGCVCVQVSSHVLDLELQLLLCAVGGSLRAVSAHLPLECLAVPV